MDTTRVSLLQRVRDRSDAVAWEEFVRLYRPILLRYARARGLNPSDAEDIAQSCLATITEKIASFEYDPTRGRFRGWLRMMVNRRVLNMLQKRRERSADSEAFLQPQQREPAPEEVWNKIWLEEHLKYCLDQIRPQVEHKTFEAFRRAALEHEPIEQVCHALKMNAGQVYVARSRVTKRLREAMQALLGDDYDSEVG